MRACWCRPPVGGPRGRANRLARNLKKPNLNNSQNESNQTSRYRSIAIQVPGARIAAEPHQPNAKEQHPNSFHLGNKKENKRKKKKEKRKNKENRETERRRDGPPKKIPSNYDRRSVPFFYFDFIFRICRLSSTRFYRSRKANRHSAVRTVINCNNPIERVPTAHRPARAR